MAFKGRQAHYPACVVDRLWPQSLSLKKGIFLAVNTDAVQEAQTEGGKEKGKKNKKLTTWHRQE